MKVTKYVSIDTEIEVNIRPEDFLASISGSPDSMPTALQAISNCGSLLRAVPDDVIAKFSKEQKTLIFNFLSNQAGRYAMEEKKDEPKRD